MTEDDEFNLLEQRLNRQKEKEMYRPLADPKTLADTYNLINMTEDEQERQALNEHQIRTANAKLSANEKQVGGVHYQKDIQPWDYIIANKLGYLEGNIVKYVSRWKDKGGVQDLKKAQHYLQKLIEVTEK
jgi:hypothetical protein